MWELQHLLVALWAQSGSDHPWPLFCPGRKAIAWEQGHSSATEHLRCMQNVLCSISSIFREVYRKGTNIDIDQQVPSPSPFTGSGTCTTPSLSCMELSKGLHCLIVLSNFLAKSTGQLLPLPQQPLCLDFWAEAAGWSNFARRSYRKIGSADREGFSLTQLSHSLETAALDEPVVSPLAYLGGG